jgi:DNA-binding LytR/AlgR family response regulator
MERTVTTSAIVADDEPLLIDYLVDKLAKLWPQLEIVGTASNGREAIELVSRTAADIAFLDIHMPGLSGLQVAEALPIGTRVVFVTAFDEFAVDAFQRAAVDYLLKPVSDNRLAQTIARLQADTSQDREQLVDLLKTIRPSTPNHLQWIRAGRGDTVELLSVSDIVYFQAGSKYTSIVTRERELVVRSSIKELEEQLDPNQFWRIHRGIIVRVEQVVNARRDLRGRYTLTLKDRPENLRSSQSYGHLFKQM